MSPMWFLATASGLTIDNVRSIAMIGSLGQCRHEILRIIPNNALFSAFDM